MVRQLRIPGRNGSVPLAAVADVQLGSGPAALDRFDRMRNISIDVELNGLPVGEVIARADKLPSLQNPATGRIPAVFRGMRSAWRNCLAVLPVPC